MTYDSQKSNATLQKKEISVVHNHTQPNLRYYWLSDNNRLEHEKKKKVR